MEPIRVTDRLDDPIVDEVRAIREAMDEEAGHDLNKLAERVRRIGEEYRRKRGAAVIEIPSPDSTPCSL